MKFITIALVVVVIALIVLFIVAARHIPQLRALNVESDEKEKTRRVKEAIILKRLSRGSEPAIKVGKLLKAIFVHVRSLGRRSIHRLRALEEHYQDLKHRGEKGTVLNTDELTKAMDEASQLVRDEQFSQAEKKYIEVISLNPRKVHAYESLGRLYTKIKQYDQAEQSLRFALKLSPQDASVRASLGELYMQEEQWSRAMEELAIAIEKRSGNPKYLDRYIESALMAKKPIEAKDGIGKLKASNPDNQKIKEFEERLASL
ncbi:MAG: tetratricopeptide repeat protein [bacterium]|nr:tetratricopeptide repeat protein [bacterium]